MGIVGSTLMRAKCSPSTSSTATSRMPWAPSKRCWLTRLATPAEVRAPVTSPCDAFRGPAADFAAVDFPRPLVLGRRAFPAARFALASRGPSSFAADSAARAARRGRRGRFRLGGGGGHPASPAPRRGCSRGAMRRATALEPKKCMKLEHLTTPFGHSRRSLVSARSRRAVARRHAISSHHQPASAYATHLMWKMSAHPTTSADCPGRWAEEAVSPSTRGEDCGHGRSAPRGSTW